MVLSGGNIVNIVKGNYQEPYFLWSHIDDFNFNDWYFFTTDVKRMDLAHILQNFVSGM